MLAARVDALSSVLQINTVKGEELSPTSCLLISTLVHGIYVQRSKQTQNKEINVIKIREKEDGRWGKAVRWLGRGKGICAAAQAWLP